MSEIKFIDGLRVFKPRDTAPEFVKADIILNKQELMAWLEGQDGTIRIQINESQQGKWYAKVNEFEPKKDWNPDQVKQSMGLAEKMEADENVPF